MTKDEIRADFFNSTTGGRSGGTKSKSRGFITHNMRERSTLTGVAIKPRLVNNGKVHVLRRPK